MQNTKSYDFKYARECARLSQKEAGEIVGVGRSTVVRWEKGEAEIPILKFRAFLSAVDISKENIPPPLEHLKYKPNGYPEGFDRTPYELTGDFDAEEAALAELEGDTHAEKARYRFLVIARRYGREEVERHMKAYDTEIATISTEKYTPPGGDSERVDMFGRTKTAEEWKVYDRLSYRQKLNRIDPGPGLYGAQLDAAMSDYDDALKNGKQPKDIKNIHRNP